MGHFPFSMAMLNNQMLGWRWHQDDPQRHPGWRWSQRCHWKKRGGMGHGTPRLAHITYITPVEHVYCIYTYIYIYIYVYIYIYIRVYIYIYNYLTIGYSHPWIDRIWKFQYIPTKMWIFWNNPHILSTSGWLYIQYTHAVCIYIHIWYAYCKLHV